MSSQEQSPEETQSVATPGAPEPADGPAVDPATEEQAPAAADSLDEIEDFGTAFAQWEGGLKPLKEGEVVHGRVIKILDKEVIVDVGYKSEGVIDIDEVRGPDGFVTVKEGDRI